MPQNFENTNTMCDPNENPVHDSHAHISDVSKSLPLDMIKSLEEMNVLIGHLIDEGARFYTNDKKQIRKMQEAIGKAGKHYSC